ncbi:MAG: glycosyltransferase [Pseudomonadota bacterium]
MTAPFFSIITVSYKDAWAFTKTARSVFRQTCDDKEYLIIDGNSEDGTKALTHFWKENGLVDRSIHEPDIGVYDAMNKGIAMATGRYICFMNAGDIFSEDDTLDRVKALLSENDLDGCMGWGQLGDQIWASWKTGPAFKLASLGFCHQALFVRRERLAANLFDARKHKTDSDTLQLGRLFEQGANIRIVPEVWAMRGGEPGISANLERTRISITDTLMSEYGIEKSIAEQVIAFRRHCECVPLIAHLLSTADRPFREHLALLVLDTLFQRPSRSMEQGDVDQLYSAAFRALGEHAASDVDRLIMAQSKRDSLLRDMADARASLHKDIKIFGEQEDQRLAKLNLPKPDEDLKSPDYVVALTSFPARLPTLHFVIHSLFEQTLPPKAIYLTLGRDEVPQRHWLPRALLEFEEKGLHINFVDKTCHQYDKYLHLTELNSEQPYVIVDDDVIYRPHALEILLTAHGEHPKSIIGNRCHLMAIESDGRIGPYKDWKREQTCPLPSHALMPTGAGGVLYPPGFFSDPILSDVDLIMANAPYADDIWLKTCALAKNIPAYATRLSQGSEWYHRYTPTMRAGTLMASNVELGLNDMQFTRCMTWLDAEYPNWHRLLTGELKEAV